MLFCPTDYTELGGDEELPLGAEFQEHIQCFVDPQAKTAEEQYRQAGKLIKQLAYVLPVHVVEITLVCSSDQLSSNIIYTATTHNTTLEMKRAKRGV